MTATTGNHVDVMTATTCNHIDLVRSEVYKAGGFTARSLCKLGLAI